MWNRCVIYMIEVALHYQWKKNLERRIPQPRKEKKSNGEKKKTDKTNEHDISIQMKMKQPKWPIHFALQ